MKERKNNKIGGLLVVLLALGLSMSVVGTAVAQTEIPAGATIDSATLWIYATEVNSQTVNVHQVTADWQEMVVTWGNFGGYASDIVRSFFADTVGWYSVDVKALVQDWADGTPNQGLLLEQGVTPLTRYASSEYATVDMRPKLVIAYTAVGSSSSVTVTIQRSGAVQEDVADAYLWEPDPNWQRGDAPELYTGLWWSGGEKQTLLRFDFTSVPGGGGGHTPGFWQNKHGLGRIEQYNLLGMINDLCLADDYGYIADFADTKAFKAWIKKRRATNMAYQLSGHLVAMKLNVAVGFVDGGALVYLNMEGDMMISINNLMADAAAALCEDGYTPAGDENRDYQEMLKDALDYANNNLNWVNP